MYQNHEYKNRFRILKGGLISLVVASNLYAAPSGGTVVSGNATINQSGNTTNINQSSQKASINWQDFSIKSNETVNFNQPNQNSITLNRVIGNEKSIIDGALNANGQVWLINSNGTLFGKNAKVNTSGFLVTTKNLSDEDFQAGNYSFKGDSKATIENLGEISSEKYAAFVANAVINNGTIKVHSGAINLSGASEFSINLDENSNIALKIDKGVLDALVENNNLLIANGGNVYLTTNAKNELLKGVVNNKGIIEANSLDDLGKQSEVIIFAHGGTANIDGTINAKGSFVETSGDKVKIKDNFKVTADTWLIDPVDFTIAASGGDMTGTTLSNNLATADVEIQSTSGTVNTNGKGDIYVNDTVSWSSDKTLTLNAQNDIFINKSISATNDNGKLALKYGQSSETGGNSDYYVNAKVNLKAGNNFSTQKGSDVANLKEYKVITTLGSAGSTTGTDLQGIQGNLSGNYVLGDDIDASASNYWEMYVSGIVRYRGFNPIGDNTNNFEGVFDGLGHTISSLYINPDAKARTGMFGQTSANSQIKNLGLKVTVTGGQSWTGGLVGLNNGIISNVFVDGSVSANFTSASYVGGIAGANGAGATIKNSYSTGYRTGSNYIGGLVGSNSGRIENSYYTSSMMASNFQNGRGGVAGTNSGTIVNSFYDKDTYGSANPLNDTPLGKTKAEILAALKGKNGWGVDDNPNLEGYGVVLLPFLSGVTKEADKNYGTLFASGYGTQASPYGITTNTQMQNINHSEILTKNYHFLLKNDILGFSNWNPIGDNTNKFSGIFNGNGYKLSGLYIFGSPKDHYGLFGYTDTNAIIRNLGLTSVSINSNGNVGGLVAVNGGLIENSYVQGNIGTNNNGVLGGLVGINNGTISNSYYNGTMGGFNNNQGGLVNTNNGTITNSFYDNTKFTGDGVKSGTATGVTGLSTDNMLYGKNFKDASWDIVADSSLDSGTPVRKWDSVNNKYVWAIAPKTIAGNLSNQAVTYNGLLQNLSSIYTSQAIFGTDGMSFKFVDENNNDITAYKNAGTYSNIGVVLTGTDEFTVAGVGTKGTLTINKATLDIVANSDSKVYNGQTQSVSGYTFGTNGLLGSDTASVFALNELTTSNSKNVGTYNTNITQNGVADNYTLNITQGKLEITKANITITGLSIDDKIYDGDTSAIVNTTNAGYTGLISGDVVSLSGTPTATFANKNVGTHNIVLSGVTLSGTDAGNYNVTAPSSLTASIIQKELNIYSDSISGNSKTYDGSTSATLSSSATMGGFVPGESISFYYLANFEDKNVGENKTINVKYYLSDNGSVKASNYKIATGQETATTTANILKKDLTIDNVIAENKTYNANKDATLSNVGKLVGLVDDEELELTYASAEFSDKNVGAGKTVTISGYTIADKDTNLASNYNLTQTSKTTTANISRANLEITGLTANDKEYNGNTIASVNIGTVGYEGKFENDVVSLSGTPTAQFANQNVGTHNITLSGVTLTGADAGNYNVTAPSSLTASITQKELEISNGSLAGVNKTYDGGTTATVTNAGTLTGLVGTETLALNYSAGFEDKNAGTGKTVNVEYSLGTGTGLASNYKIKEGQETTTTTADIYKKAVSNVSYTVDNKVYDGNYNAVAKGSSTDFIAGDKIGFTQTAIFDDKNVGDDINIAISNIALSGTDAGNYNLTDNSDKTSSADITKKDLKVIVTDESKIYDGVAFNGGKVVYNGFVTGEDESVFTDGSLVFTGDGLGATNIGKYSLSAKTSGFDADNYNISYIDGVLDIKVKPSVIAPQNGEINKVVNSIQTVVQVFNPNQLFGANSTTADNQAQNELAQTNTNPNTQTFSFGRNLGLEVVNGGINAPVNGVEDFEDLLLSQKISKR